MPTLRQIADAVEAFAPREFQESYDNAGIQVGDPDMEITGMLIALDVTEDVLEEAIQRGCNMILSHHPLLFHGLKQIVGASPAQRIVASAIRNNIAIYAAHTNLDATWEGVSYEMAHMLDLRELQPLEPRKDAPRIGLGIVGNLKRPMPVMEFLRHVKETFDVRGLRFSSQSPQLVVRRVAACGGAGASLIPEAIASGADIYLTGDLKYHDYTTYASDIVLTDVGHYESEICSRHIFARILKDNFPNLTAYLSETDKNPIGSL